MHNEPPFHNIQETVNTMIRDIQADKWPSKVAQCDFGITDEQHYEALYYPIVSGELQSHHLVEIAGFGVAITAVVNECKNNPHKGIEFKTPWDTFLDTIRLYQHYQVSLS